jgi:cold-inducible RNA-binding protein
MSTNIYVGNLSPRTTQEEVRNLFTPYGEVDSVNLITDRYSGDSRGFGFVMMTATAARQAIAGLDRKSVDGQNIKVNEARPRQQRVTEGASAEAWSTR